jgi:formylglycine-generating enzyme required for sulfatase activity
MVLARLPTSDRPGLAVQPHAVTRRDYAAFVAATRHAGERCRIRTAAMTLRKRTWDQPGFDQQDNHPVVCVSAADAAAYATWLGKRDGQRYRLPSKDEWNTLALGSGKAVCSGRCDGTAPIDTAAMVAPGIRGHAGSAREWTADCSGSCEHRLTLGTSWRDASAKPGARDPDAIDGDNGYDDIGFRLLRSVAVAEVEQH